MKKNGVFFLAVFGLLHGIFDALVSQLARYGHDSDDVLIHIFMSSI